MIRAEDTITLTRVNDGETGKSAYEAAIEGGLPITTTEQEFNEDLADVPQLDERITQAENDIGTIEGNITSLQGRVQTAEGDITSIEGEIGNPSDAASGSGSLYARVKNVKDTADGAVQSINAEVVRAQAAEQAASQAATNAQTQAAAASTAANNAGRAASLAQAALDTMGDYEWAMVAVSSPTGNPKEKKYWERTGTSPNYNYHYTTDTSVVSGKTYYQLNQEGQYFYKDSLGAHIVDGSDNGFRTDIQSNGMKITDTSTNNVVAAFTASGYNIGNVDAPHQVGAPLSWKMIDWDGNTYAEIKDTRSGVNEKLVITFDTLVSPRILPTRPEEGLVDGIRVPIPYEHTAWDASIWEVSDNITGTYNIWSGSGTKPAPPYIDVSQITDPDGLGKKITVYYGTLPEYDDVEDVGVNVSYVIPNKYCHGYKFGIAEADNGVSAISSATSVAEGICSVSFGLDNQAHGVSSYAEGYSTEANGDYSHAEGKYTTTGVGGMSGCIGEAAHAEGYYSIASGNYGSHAEGERTEASGRGSHSEGYNTTASRDSSHAEGYNTTASGVASHAEGWYTEANGDYSHAEGADTTASGAYSHAEGYYSEASGYVAHAEGVGTTASGRHQHVQGKYNVEDTNDTWADIVGNGTSSIRRNASALDWDGNLYLDGDVYTNYSGGNTKNGTKVSVEGHTHSGYITQAQLLNFIYPVGSIYMSANNVSPQTFLGGTWTAFGAGRVPVGVGTGTDDEGLQQTYAVNDTGGVYERIMSRDNLPEHSHTISHTHSYTDTTYSKTAISKKPGSNSATTTGYNITGTANSKTSGAASASSSGNTGSGMPMNIEQPYIAVYMWKRTA